MNESVHECAVYIILYMDNTLVDTFEKDITKRFYIIKK